MVLGHTYQKEAWWKHTIGHFLTYLFLKLSTMAHCLFNCNWRCFRTVVSEKTLESSLDCKEIQPVHSEGDQLWDFFGRNDAKAETPVLWPPDAKSWLIGKDSDAGRDWGQEEKGTTEDEMAGWHHGLDGCESEWTPGVGDGQGGLACCDSWGRKESDTTEWLNWTEDPAEPSLSYIETSCLSDCTQNDYAEQNVLMSCDIDTYET